MAQEIERKFLVRSDLNIESLGQSIHITQGYLSSAKERTVRVRIKGDKAFLTIKGVGNPSGTSRYEFEKEIEIREAEELLSICEPGIIEKIRTIIPVGKHVFEVDTFLGENKGLVVAEIELEAEDELFDKPEWIAMEVTGDSKYYNSMLAKNPFKQW